MRLVVIVFLIGMLPTCSGSVGQKDGGDGEDAVDAGGEGGDVADGNGGDKGPPPLLDSSHMGWKNQQCDLCHSLPRPDHTTSHPPDCASCHGGNGACGLDYSSRPHQRTENCMACHQSKHGFGSNADCTSCHFAFAGTVDCNESLDGGLDGGGGDGDGGPVLSDALESGCFNWPAEEFSSDNHAQVGTIAEGSLAVEFTLKDVDGAAYTLSDLLREKPVLMVFGAYT